MITLLVFMMNKDKTKYMHRHALMFPAKFKYNAKSLNMNIHNTHGTNGIS